MGFDKRQSAKSYTPRDGDTLDAIAERETAAGNPITAADIARFNWGTSDPAAINEFLRDDLGARKRGADKGFVISADDEPRTPLKIPVAFQKDGLTTDRVHTLRVRAEPAPAPQFLECACIPGVTFEFDKSFIRPTVVDHLKPLEQALQKNPDSRVIVFGHTDKVGSDSYNKLLSERRAKSVFAFITNDADTWEALHVEEKWGIRAVQEVLKDLGGEFDPGPVDGVDGPQTKAAVKKYQGARGLAVDGVAGPSTRKKLYAEYMSSKHDIQVTPDQFMEPKHMGCGEFNPVLQTEEAHEPNRRVVIFLFHKDRPPKVPCKFGDLEPCKKQSNPPAPRFVDTFKCSFFDSIARDCGCAKGEPPPPPVVSATLELVFDAANNHGVGPAEAATQFVRMGLWDNAFDATTGNLRNDAAEDKNFVGDDSRRFYVRVKDASAKGQPEVKAQLRTTNAGGASDDAPASQDVTLLPSTADDVFVSRGLFLVADDVDRKQATNSGLPAGNADAGDRNADASNHRTRRVTVDDASTLDSRIAVEYTPFGGGTKATASLPLFQRSPEERRRMKVHLVNVRKTVGGAGILTATRKAQGVQQMRNVYAACGIVLDVDEIPLDPPASCIGWKTRYPTSAVADDPAVEGPSFPGGNLVPSKSQQDIIDAVRALPGFDANDLFLVYVSRIYADPVPPPPGGPPGPALALGPGGIAFPDSFTAAGSTARSFVFIGVTTVNVMADAHEMTHVTTNLRNSAGGHFHLQASVSAGPGPLDGKNLMQRFALISTGAISDSKRLWDRAFTNSGISPPTIPAQISAIRGSRFVKPL